MKRNGQQQKLFDDARLLARVAEVASRRARDRAHRAARRHDRAARVHSQRASRWNSAPLLLAYIRGVDWATVDYPTRLTALHEVNVAITGSASATAWRRSTTACRAIAPNVFRDHPNRFSSPPEAAPSRSACRLEETNTTSIKDLAMNDSHAIPRQQRRRLLRLAHQRPADQGPAPALERDERLDGPRRPAAAGDHAGARALRSVAVLEGQEAGRDHHRQAVAQRRRR